MITFKTLDEQLEAAIKIAVDAHKGQTDKNGQPYILHPIAVMSTVETTIQKTYAILHDVLEDTKYSEIDLSKYGIWDSTIVKLRLITKNDNESNKEYIQRCCSDNDIRLVKIADIKHNMSWDRFGQLPEEVALRLTKKYMRSLHTLLNYKEK